jgi:uncharacterized damage-inducible protein DinB
MIDRREGVRGSGIGACRYALWVSRILLDQVLADMGQAFDLLFSNLKDLRDDDWAWVPPGGVRSIHDIVGHAASSKVMFENHAFGDASLDWMDAAFDLAQPRRPGEAVDAPALIAWLRDSELRLLRSVDGLADDAELERERGVPWGGRRTTRWIIRHLVQHDAFHAGEINHLRAVHQRDDMWEWERTSGSDAQ